MTALFIPADGGTQLSVLGTPVVIRVHGRDTNGNHSVIESHDAPGGGPPLHLHRSEDETFYVIEGPYEFTVGGQHLTAQRGDTLFAPREMPHSYRYVGRSIGRLLCVCTPAGLEDFFAEISALPLQHQKDLERVMAVGSKYGLEFPKPD